MIFGRPGALGLLLLLGSLTACTSRASAPPEPTGAAALPGYDAPYGAPGFCTLLAGSTHLAQVPSALGALTVDPADPAARQVLAAAVDDLRLVLDDVRPDVTYAELETAVEDLVAALTEASGGRLADGIGEAVGAALTTIGEQAQPACEFPT